MSQPLVDRRDGHCGLVTDGEFVVACGHGPVAFERVDAALHAVTLFVGVLVERRSATTARTTVLAVADLVCLLRNGAPDAPSPQVGAISAGTVRLIRQHPVRARPRPAPTDAGHVD